MIPADGGGQVQVSGVVLIPADPAQPAVPGILLTIDHRGVVVQWGATEPRVLRWETVTGWRVDPYTTDGRPGAMVTVQTAQNLFRFAAPGADTASLNYVVDDLCRRFTRLAAAAPPTGAPVAVTTTVPGVVAEAGAVSASAPATGATPGVAPANGALDRWRPLLVAGLIVVLAVAVALVLAQSAGAIHWPILGGGTGGAGKTGGVVPFLPAA